MRVLKVVDRPPVVEGVLQFIAVCELFPLQHFRLQIAVKTFQSLLRLRMIRPGMPHPDIQAHQLQFQHRPGAGGVAPQWVVIHGHPVQQAITFKHIDQLLLHGLASFIGTVRQV